MLKELPPISEDTFLERGNFGEVSINRDSFGSVGLDLKVQETTRLITKRRKIILAELYSAILDECSNVASEDESDALYLDGEVTEYSDLKTESETDLENNPVHEDYRDSNSNTNVCFIHPFKL
ncbi:hypothetical protein AVEN_45725-1 [Araneus ventricosus]|uniref:Uncharacterized protein n=1 Tax=Araneus ventricosus TaxID=182803 RepID=A0A4Y2KD18_ARAVE|nr:hypothetical protein AVEN_45725-1 [Araneus ventricosus]